MHGCNQVPPIKPPSCIPMLSSNALSSSNASRLRFSNALPKRCTQRHYNCTRQHKLENKRYSHTERETETETETDKQTNRQPDKQTTRQPDNQRAKYLIWRTETTIHSMRSDSKAMIVKVCFSKISNLAFVHSFLTFQVSFCGQF